MEYAAWYGVSSLALGVLLFFPMRRFMLALNINRHQRKVQRPITEEEREVLNKKVTVLAALIAITFAFIYNRFLLFAFWGPAR